MKLSEILQEARKSHADRSKLQQHQSRWPEIIQDLKKFVPMVRDAGFDMSTLEKVHTLYNVGSQFSDKKLSFGRFNAIVTYARKYRSFDLTSIMGPPGKFDPAGQLALRLKIGGATNNVLLKAAMRRDAEQVAKYTLMNIKHVKSVFDDEQQMKVLNRASNILGGVKILSHEDKQKNNEEVRANAAKHNKEYAARDKTFRRIYQPKLPNPTPDSTSAAASKNMDNRSKEEKIVDLVAVYKELSYGGKNTVTAEEAAEKLGVQPRTVDKWHEWNDPRVKALDSLRPQGRTLSKVAKVDLLRHNVAQARGKAMDSITHYSNDYKDKPDV